MCEQSLQKPTFRCESRQTIRKQIVPASASEHFCATMQVVELFGRGEGLSFNFLRGTSVLTNRSNRSEGNRSIGYQQFDTGAGRRQRGRKGGVGREEVGGARGV